MPPIPHVRRGSHTRLTHSLVHPLDSHQYRVLDGVNYASETWRGVITGCRRINRVHLRSLINVGSGQTVDSSIVIPTSSDHDHKKPNIAVAVNEIFKSIPSLGLKEPFLMRAY